MKWPVLHTIKLEYILNRLNVESIHPDGRTSTWKLVEASDGPSIRYPQYNLPIAWNSASYRRIIHLSLRHHRNAAGVGKVGAEPVRGLSTRQHADELTAAIKANTASHSVPSAPRNPPGHTRSAPQLPLAQPPPANWPLPEFVSRHPHLEAPQPDPTPFQGASQGLPGTPSRCVTDSVEDHPSPEDSDGSFHSADYEFGSPGRGTPSSSPPRRVLSPTTSLQGE